MQEYGVLKQIVWLGIGDTTSNEFIAMLYDQEGATSYNDVTLPKLTNQTSFDSVAYIDKHPQPSTHPDMPALIKQYYGRLRPSYQLHPDGPAYLPSYAVVSLKPRLSAAVSHIALSGIPTLPDTEPHVPLLTSE